MLPLSSPIEGRKTETHYQHPPQDSATAMMNNIKRNVDFFKFNSTIQLILLYEKKLLHANKDQINVISQFTLNMLKKKIPLPPTDRGQT